MKKIRIELPEVELKEGVRAHIFPLQIGEQVKEMIRATETHLSLTGRAVETMWQNEEWTKIVFQEESKVYSQESFRLGFQTMIKYAPLFESYIRQHAVIFLVSEWDWYVTKLMQFLRRSWKMEEWGGKTKRPQGFKKDKTVSEIEADVRRIQNLCGVSEWPFDPRVVEQWNELSLVRNLGIHHRWEVNRHYLKASMWREYWYPGDLRIPIEDEVVTWIDCVKDAVNNTSVWAAKRFADAPAYHGLAEGLDS